MRIIFLILVILALTLANASSAQTFISVNDTLDITGVVGAPTAVILSPPFNITTSSMQLSWTQNLDADFSNYKLYYSTTPGVTSASILAATITISGTTTYTVNALNQNIPYYFMVLVTNTSSLSTPSNEVSDSTLSGGTTFGQLAPNPPLLTLASCPYFITPALLNGTKSADIIEVFVNNSSAGVDYPLVSSWEKMMALILGINPINLFGKNSSGVSSITVSYNAQRCEIGDVNCNTAIDDFDLAGEAWHWLVNWCPGDFNKDLIVDDFDLAGLAAHWNP